MPSSRVYECASAGLVATNSQNGSCEKGRLLWFEGAPTPLSISGLCKDKKPRVRERMLIAASITLSLSPLTLVPKHGTGQLKALPETARPRPSQTPGLTEL